MAKTAWPAPDRRKNIGARISRLDGAAKVTGAAKYAYDMNREGLLYAKIYQSPHALATPHCTELIDSPRFCLPCTS